jgi:hypothetical protein
MWTLIAFVIAIIAGLMGSPAVPKGQLPSKSITTQM